MSLIDTGLTIRYRRFRAHHEHTYPITFFLIGVGKFVLEIAFLCFVCLSLVLLAMKVSGSNMPGFLTAKTSQQPTADPAVEVAEADALRATPVDAAIAAVSLPEKRPDASLPDPSLRHKSLSDQVAGVMDEPVSLAVQTETREQSNPLSTAGHSEFDQVRYNNTVLDAVNVAGANSDNPLQKIVIARSKKGVDTNQVAAIFDHEWILSRPGHHFVIQLASSPRLDKLLEFSRELNSESKVSVFPFKVSSSQELLYGVAAGEYATLQQAMLAVKDYPDSARRYSPWVRKMSDVQKDIKSVSGQPEFQQL